MEHFNKCLPSEAFSRRRVELIDEYLDVTSTDNFAQAFAARAEVLGRLLIVLWTEFSGDQLGQSDPKVLDTRVRIVFVYLQACVVIGGVGGVSFGGIYKLEMQAEGSQPFAAFATMFPHGAGWEWTFGVLVRPVRIRNETTPIC